MLKFIYNSMRTMYNYCVYSTYIPSTVLQFNVTTIPVGKIPTEINKVQIYMVK